MRHALVHPSYWPILSAVPCVALCQGLPHTYRVPHLFRIAVLYSTPGALIRAVTHAPHPPNCPAVSLARCGPPRAAGRLSSAAASASCSSCWRSSYSVSSVGWRRGRATSCTTSPTRTFTCSRYGTNVRHLRYGAEERHLRQHVLMRLLSMLNALPRARGMRLAVGSCRNQQLFLCCSSLCCRSSLRSRTRRTLPRLPRWAAGWEGP